MRVPGETKKRVPFVLPAEVSESDWSEFRGPNRDGRVDGVTFETDWKSNPPREALAPLGWTGMVVVLRRWTSGFYSRATWRARSGDGLSGSDGELIWISTSEGRFEASMGGIGPRATPTFRPRTSLCRRLRPDRYDASTRRRGESIWEYDVVDEHGRECTAMGFRQLAADRR